MLDDRGFDLWADGYDHSVLQIEQSDAYPFAGYRRLLDLVYGQVRSRSGRRVLDVGFGTAALTNRLYQDDYEIYGLDFSEHMIAIARDKMPQSTLIQCDFAQGLPKELHDLCFDAIISTYALHHLSDRCKITFIDELSAHLKDDGILLIGDIGFQTRAQLDACRANYGDSWDEDEVYLVFDELLPHLGAGIWAWRQVSHCAGLLMLTR